jgi:hypothetical protein
LRSLRNFVNFAASFCQCKQQIAAPRRRRLSLRSSTTQSFATAAVGFAAVSFRGLGRGVKTAT